MPRAVINNPESDLELSALVAEVFDTLPEHWQRRLPKNVLVNIATTSFDRIPELAQVCDEQRRLQPEWDNRFWMFVQVVGQEYSQDVAILWVRRSPDIHHHNPHYQFKKELYTIIGQLLWHISEEVRREAMDEATGMAQGSVNNTYLGFCDSFARYFLNPDYLRTRKQSAWRFMRRLDLALAG